MNRASRPGIAAVLVLSIIVPLLVIQGTGCASRSTRTVPTDEASPTIADSMATVENKFEAPLRLRMREMEQMGDDGTIQCFMELDTAMDDRRRTLLEEAGLRVITEVGTIATVEGSAAALKRAAAYPFVKGVSLSQTRYPQE